MGVVGQVEAFGLSIAEIAILVGALFFLAELLGVSRSSRTLRKTNRDLGDRVTALEDLVGSLRTKAAEDDAMIAALQSEMSVMRERDQPHLLDALKTHDAFVAGLAAEARTWQERHETSAETRTAAVLQVLSQIRDNLQPKGDPS